MTGPRAHPDLAVTQSTQVLHGDFACPSCASENTQRFEVIFNTGTAMTSQTSLHGGVAITGTGIAPALGASQSLGTHQSRLAAFAAPPMRRNEISLALLMSWLVLSVFLSAAAGGCLASVLEFPTPAGYIACAAFIELIFVVTCVSVYVGNADARRWNRELPARYSAWKHTYLCHRCGKVFRPGNLGQQQA